MLLNSQLNICHRNSMGAFSHNPAPKRPYPKTPIQKVRRRIAVGKKTGRLDLSTEVHRAEESADGDNNEEDSVAYSSISGSQHSKWKEPEMVKPGTVSDRRETVEYKLEQIPEEVFTIKGLSELWLCYNPLKSVSPKLAELDTLQVLSLAGVGLTSIPLEVSGLINLKRLYLQKNSISSIPEDFSSLSLLTDLNISHNKFTGPIPDVILGFFDLALLDISFNQFSAVPSTIMKLKTLSLLNVSGNGISEIPPEIPRRMPSLLVIGVESGNRSKKYWQPENYGISPEEEKEMVSFIKSRAKQKEEDNILGTGVQSS